MFIEKHVKTEMMYSFKYNFIYFQFNDRSKAFIDIKSLWHSNDWRANCLSDTIRSADKISDVIPTSKDKLHLSDGLSEYIEVKLGVDVIVF